MLIYGEIDERLSSVVTFDSFSTENNYLMVVHPFDTEEWIKLELDFLMGDERCQGVLVVKGVPRGGLTDGKIADLRAQYGDRFHVSSCSVGSVEEATRLTGDLETRFRDFFQHVRSADSKIDWSILDPQWPDKLFSAYLLAKALSDGMKEAEIIQSRTVDWTPIWEDAKKEHLLLTDKILTHSQLDISTAGEIAAQIMQYLEKVAARTR